MREETLTLKSEVMSALDSLPLDSLKLLAEFTAFLQTKLDKSKVSTEMDSNTVNIAIDSPTSPIFMLSPRLVNREQLADFKMEVTMEMTHD